MLTAYSATGNVEPSPAAADVTWIDLLNPTQDEIASVERRLGKTLPTRADLSEIETSSRVSEENGVLFLSMPTVSVPNAADQPPAPVGFVLSKDLLVTIHYTPLRSFDAVATKCTKDDTRHTGVETFAILVDEMVDLLADLLEQTGADLDAVSRAVFRRIPGKRRHQTQSNEALRDVLTDVGSAGERLSRIRDSLLGLQRIVPFVSGMELEWIPPKIHFRLKAAQADLLSLADYETHMFGKVQFLLDAVLGFINTKQNEIFTILTVVSVVGVPPTLIASIYGMNFRHMPELDWAWGYPYGLALIALSIIVPILWFKWRGWL